MTIESVLKAGMFVISPGFRSGFVDVEKTVLIATRLVVCRDVQVFIANGDEHIKPGVKSLCVASGDERIKPGVKPLCVANGDELIKPGGKAVSAKPQGT